jgi:hypothetical protein
MLNSTGGYYDQKIEALYRAVHDYTVSRGAVLILSDLIGLGDDPLVNEAVRESYEDARRAWRQAAVALKETAAEIADATIAEIDNG